MKRNNWPWTTQQLVAFFRWMIYVTSLIPISYMNNFLQQLLFSDSKRGFGCSCSDHSSWCNYWWNWSSSSWGNYCCWYVSFITVLIHNSSDYISVGVTSCFNYSLLKLLFIFTCCRRISVPFKLSFLSKVLLHVGSPFVYCSP